MITGPPDIVAAIQGTFDSAILWTFYPAIDAGSVQVVEVGYEQIPQRIKFGCFFYPLQYLC